MGQNFRDYARRNEGQQPGYFDRVAMGWSASPDPIVAGAGEASRLLMNLTRRPEQRIGSGTLAGRATDWLTGMGPGESKPTRMATTFKPEFLENSSSLRDKIMLAAVGGNELVS